MYLLQVSICLGAFYAFYYFVLRKDTFFQLNRIYLLGSLLLSLCIPYFQITLSDIEANTAAYYLGLDDLLVESVSTAMFTSSRENWWTIENGLLAIYGLGVLFFLTKMLVNLSALFRLMRNSKVIKNEGYSLVQIDEPHPVFSFLNFIFWNKQLSYSDDEARQILLHEQVHIQQKHTWDNLFLELCHALLWFNPFLYFYKKSLKNTHEYIADYHLFERHRFQISYVDLLMKEAKKQQGSSIAITHTFFNNQLKERLIMIKNSNKHSNKLKFLACLPIVAMLFFSFSLEQTASAQTAHTEQSDSPQSGNIYVVSDVDNDFTIKSDGTRRSKEEIKEYIVQKNKAEGKTVEKEQIFVISKKEMMRNLSSTDSPDLPVLKEEFRLVFAKSLGALMLMEKGADKSFNAKWPIKSFTGTIQKPEGLDANGKQNYITMALNYEGNKLNAAAMEMIESIASKDLKLAKFIVSDIVTTKDGKDYKIDNDFELSLE